MKSKIRDKGEWSKLHRALVGGTLVMVGACFLAACSDDNGAPAASADAAEQDHGSAPADDVAFELDDGTATADDMLGAQDSSEADSSLLSFVNDADCELKCKGDYCMVVCPDASGGQGGWKPCDAPHVFNDGGQVGDDCWAPPGNWCASGGGGAVTAACSADGTECCMFSSTCVPCGWEVCEGGETCGGLEVEATYPAPADSVFASKCEGLGKQWEIDHCAVCSSALVCPSSTL